MKIKDEIGYDMDNKQLYFEDENSMKNLNIYTSDIISYEFKSMLIQKFNNSKSFIMIFSERPRYKEIFDNQKNDFCLLDLYLRRKDYGLKLFQIKLSYYNHMEKLKIQYMKCKYVSKAYVSVSYKTM